MFNQPRYEKLINIFYMYKDFQCKEQADEYYYLRSERTKFLEKKNICE